MLTSVPSWIHSWLFYLGGALFILLNVYTSFIRPWLHSRSNKPDEQYQHVSGAPFIGSFLMLFGVIGMFGDGHPIFGWLGVLLILCDTGGPGAILYAIWLTIKGEGLKD